MLIWMHCVSDWLGITGNLFYIADQVENPQPLGAGLGTGLHMYRQRIESGEYSAYNYHIITTQPERKVGGVFRVLHTSMKKETTQEASLKTDLPKASCLVLTRTKKLSKKH